MKQAGFLLFLGLLGCAANAHAYPNTIRYGYIDCHSCHVSTLGGAQLTDYGKAYADASSFFARMKEDEESEPSRFNPAVFARYIYMDVAGESDSFLMQADGMLTVDVNHRAQASVAVGWVPEVVQSSPSPPSGILGKSFLLRKATFQYSFDDQHKSRVVIGRENLPMSIRMDDHTTYLRLYSRQGVTDYPTQVRYETTSSNRQFSVGAFLPSFEESLRNREIGAFVREEHRLSKNTAVVGLVLYGKGNNPSGPNAVDSRIHGDLGVRHAWDSKLGILASLQGARRVLSGEPVIQSSLYARAFYFPAEWLEIGYVGEKLWVQKPFFAQRLTHGPDLYFRLVKELTIVAQMKWMDSFGSPLSQNLFTLQAFGRI